MKRNSPKNSNNNIQARNAKGLTQDWMAEVGQRRQVRE